MIKYTGIFMLALVCVWSGFSLAQRLKMRSEFLTHFISALCSLETEICFSMSNLKEIFQRLGGEAKLCRFFEECAEQMDESGIKTAWDKATDILGENASLKDKDIALIRTLGSELGKSDCVGQKNAIERVCELLKVSEQEARDEYVRLSGTYKKCGVLTAVLIAIVLV